MPLPHPSIDKLPTIDQVDLTAELFNKTYRQIDANYKYLDSEITRVTRNINTNQLQNFDSRINAVQRQLATLIDTYNSSVKSINGKSGDVRITASDFPTAMNIDGVSTSFTRNPTVSNPTHINLLQSNQLITHENMIEMIKVFAGNISFTRDNGNDGTFFTLPMSNGTLYIVMGYVYRFVQGYTNIKVNWPKEVIQYAMDRRPIAVYGCGATGCYVSQNETEHSATQGSLNVDPVSQNTNVSFYYMAVFWAPTK